MKEVLETILKFCFEAMKKKRSQLKMPYMTDKALTSRINGKKSECYYQDYYTELLATKAVFYNP